MFLFLNNQVVSINVCYVQTYLSARSKGWIALLTGWRGGHGTHYHAQETTLYYTAAGRIITLQEQRRNVLHRYVLRSTLYENHSGLSHKFVISLIQAARSQDQVQNGSTSDVVNVIYDRNITYIFYLNLFYLGHKSLFFLLQAREFQTNNNIKGGFIMGKLVRKLRAQLEFKKKTWNSNPRTLVHSL